MRTFIGYHLIRIVQIILFLNIVDAQHEGDACNHSLKGVSGVCKRLDKCPNAMQELKSGIRPQHCGFANFTPIVCCPPEATATTISSTMPTATKLPIGHEGDACNHSLKGVSGVCKRLDKCPDAMQELKSDIRPQHCGFANFTPIVCCSPEATATTISSTMPTATKLPIGQLPVGEKSRLACESYKILAYKMDHSSSSGNKNELVENCPWNHKSVGVNFDGKVAEEGEFPHMVLVGFGPMPLNYSMSCGGSLISEKFVLTAASGLYFRGVGMATGVRLGDLDYADPDDDQHVQEIKIKKIIRHPLFKISFYYHDIALLELEHPAHLSSYVKPICLYRWDPAGKVHSGMITGWGKNPLTTHNSRLLKGGIQYFSQETCNAMYINDKRTLPEGINPEFQICFGPKGNSTVDTCRGDVGGPIQIYNKDVYCSYYIFGITDFGIGCGHSNVPGGYVKIYKYIEWIESIVWP